MEDGHHKFAADSKQELDQIDVKDANLDVGVQLVASGVEYSEAGEAIIRQTSSSS